MIETARKKSVLIVDDDNANITALTHVLGREYTVFAANNGQYAIKVAKKYLPDVILLDILMPDMDGYQVLEELRGKDETQAIPIIFITGLRSIEDEKRGLALGAEDYIHKPYNPEIVKLRIRNHISVREAERMTMLKSRFLANMSHEVRTPMSAILGIAEIELQKGNLPPDTEEALSKIYESGDLLLNIINDILDLTKIESGKLEITPVEYNIPSLINDAVQLNCLRFDNKPIEFVLDLKEDTPLNLSGDVLRIKQVLNNILSNAFKYTESGKIELSVWSEATDTDDPALFFRVTDTGQGMTEEQLTHLFDEYTRFNTDANRTTLGTGLGMNITKRLLDLMNGDIVVDSEPGKGSSFTVKIPQERVDRLVCGAEIAEKLRTFNFHSTGKSRIKHEHMPYGRVLVVDDVESNLYVTKGMLLPYGLEIDTVESGFEAIEKIKSGNVYDIIFMDHMMPGMDGMEAAKRIRETGYDRPIVALTANALAGKSEMFLSNGFDAFVPKPIDSRELNIVLNDFVRDRQPRDVVETARRKQEALDLENVKRLNGSERRPGSPALPDLRKLFVLDAENAMNVLSNFDEANIEAYEITVHGMKSALANIGEPELSKFAYKLELAAKSNDLAVIKDETPAFVDALKAFVKTIKPVKNTGGDEINGEDTVYMREKLTEIIAACEAFDKDSAKAAIKDLTQKELPGWAEDSLDEINVHLLHSAFKKASAAAQEMIGELTP